MSTVTIAPRLSVGLPVYNGENYLAESIDALLGQSYEDFELVISDNASTDGTADICRSYARRDSRVRYIRQPRNIGIAPNINFLINQASGSELFKMASHDDLYARDLLRRCIDALDEHPQVVLAHSWSAVIDEGSKITELVAYPVATDAPRAPDRLRSMLFDGWGDDDGGVIRMNVLRRVPGMGSYHFADRTFTAELALHGPFYIVPERMYFRREHAGQGGKRRTVRARCANMDPRRASRLRHPVARLYAEYVWAYLMAIHSAPLAPADRRECYRNLAQWAAGRVLPVASRSISGSGLQTESVGTAQHGTADNTLVSVDAVVAGRVETTP